MVGDEQFSLAIQAETGDLHGAVGEVLVPGDLAPLVPDAIDLARRPVAVEVGADEVGQGLAAIDHSARKRAEFGMMDARRSAARSGRGPRLRSG